MAAVTDRGELFTWGSDSHGQLGRTVRSVSLRARGQIGVGWRGRGGGGRASGRYPYEASIGEASAHAPLEVDLAGALSLGRVPVRGGGGTRAGLPASSEGLEALAVSCGEAMTAVLVQRRLQEDGPDGSGSHEKVERFVATFGANDRGQAGQGLGALEVAVGQVAFPCRVWVESVVCGGRHCHALCSSSSSYSSLWSWGDNTYGQCGLSPGSGRAGGVGIGGWVAAPREVHGLGRGVCIMMVAAGMFHSAAVSDAGCVYTWGDNSCSQLGLSQEDDGDGAPGGSRLGVSQASVGEPGAEGCPQLVRGLVREQVCQVACGDFHTVAVSVLGCLYSWGLDLGGDSPAGGKQRVIQNPRPILSWPTGGSHSGITHAASAHGAGLGIGRPSVVGHMSVGGTQGASGWCCAVACGERHTLALVVEREVGEAVGAAVVGGHRELETRRLLRSRTVGGLMLTLRALRTLQWSYEVPAREAGALARPVLTEANLERVLVGGAGPRHRGARKGWYLWGRERAQQAATSQADEYPDGVAQAGGLGTNRGRWEEGGDQEEEDGEAGVGKAVLACRALLNGVLHVWGHGGDDAGALEALSGGHVSCAEDSLAAERGRTCRLEDLVEFLSMLPSRMEATREAMKAMRFANFVSTIESTHLKGRGSAELLRHPWTPPTSTSLPPAAAPLAPAEAVADISDSAHPVAREESNGPTARRAREDVEDGLVGVCAACACIPQMLVSARQGLSVGRNGIFVAQDAPFIPLLGAADDDGRLDGEGGEGEVGGSDAGYAAGGAGQGWREAYSAEGRKVFINARSGSQRFIKPEELVQLEDEEEEYRVEHEREAVSWDPALWQEMSLLASRLQERSEWLEAARTKDAAAAGAGSGVWHAVRIRLWGLLLVLRWLGVALIDLLGLDAMGDEGWPVFVLVLLALLAVPALLVYTAAGVPMYDRTGWLQVWRVKLPLSLYFLGVFCLSLRVATNIRRTRGMAQPRVERAGLRDTASNRLALLMLLVEAWQLCALSFGEGLPYDTAGIVTSAALAAPALSSAALPWSVNGAMLLGIIDLRLLLNHSTDQLIGLVLLTAVPGLWLTCRYIARRPGGFHGGGVSRKWLEGGGGEWQHSVLSRVFATIVGPSILGILYLPLLARVAQSVACSFVTARASLVLDSSLHLLAHRVANASSPAAITSCSQLVTLALPPTSSPPPRYLHARLLSDLSEGPTLAHTEPVSLCGAVPCWEWRMGGGGIVPHAAHALIGLAAFAIFFPSASLMQLADQAPDPALDIHTAPVFRVESQARDTKAEEGSRIGEAGGSW